MRSSSIEIKLLIAVWVIDIVILLEDPLVLPHGQSSARAFEDLGQVVNPFLLLVNTVDNVFLHGEGDSGVVTARGFHDELLDIFRFTDRICPQDAFADIVEAEA